MADLPIEIYEQDDVEALIAACSRRAPTGVRNRALLAVLYGAGLRIGEAVSLRPHDVDLDRAVLHVRKAKGRKSRRAALFNWAIPHLQAWIERREKIGTGDLAALFCTLAGRDLDQSYVRHLLPRLARKARIRKRVHPHGFRHSHADRLDQAGVPLREIADQLGHARTSTTDTYLTRNGRSSRFETIREVA